MRQLGAMALATALLAYALPARADASLPGVTQILGNVTSSARPVGNALVIALNLQNLEATRTFTGTDGSFALSQLRAGIYRIIAVKNGFAPAVTTLIPTRATHRVALKLESDKDGRAGLHQEIWELRGSLASDVLRDLDAMLAPVELSYDETPRIRGEMVSMTGVTNEQANPAFSQTALGVQGRLGDEWQVGLNGNLQRFEDPTDDVRFGTPIAESSVMAIELRSSGETDSSAVQSYRLASTRSSWMYAETEEGPRQADLRAHDFQWRRGQAKVQMRYVEQDNLFRGAPLGSNVLEIEGAVPLLASKRNGLGVALRVRQESIDETSESLRTADLSARGTIAAGPALVLEYGLASRIGVDGQEWAPRAGAQWQMTPGLALIGSAQYKVVDRDPSSLAIPSLVYWSDDSHILPTYAYSIGIVGGKDGENGFSAVATLAEIDEALRVVFGDGQSEFWDGFYIEAGDIRRDLRLAFRRQFGDWFAVDFASTAGTATPKLDTPQGSTKVYLTGDLQSTFTPTRTSIIISYREIEQPGNRSEDDYRTERVRLRMAQSLYLPIDIKLLLGLELARAENSPYLIDSLTPEGTSKKYIGGLAVNF